MKLSGFYIAAVIFIWLTSCSSKNLPMEYFLDIDTYNSIPVGDYSLKIEPSDELLITVNSANPDATLLYNIPTVNPALRENVVFQSTAQQQTYTVDTKGDIEFPVFGKIHVAGMTVEQLQDYLTEKISKDVENPLVYVQIIKFSVNVAGEVARPGRQNVYLPRYSILDAISQAGDLNQYGRRDNVLLIREEDGELKHIRLNLNSAELLTSPYFFLKQNDYIYVEPNEVRKDNAEYSQYYSYKLQVVATIVSGSASIISLIIALSR